MGMWKLEREQLSSLLCPWCCSPPLRTQQRLCLQVQLRVPGNPTTGRAGRARVGSLAAVIPRAKGVSLQGLSSTILAVTVFLTG